MAAILDYENSRRHGHIWIAEPKRTFYLSTLFLNIWISGLPANGGYGLLSMFSVRRVEVAGIRTRWCLRLLPFFVQRLHLLLHASSSHQTVSLPRIVGSLFKENVSRNLNGTAGTD